MDEKQQLEFFKKAFKTDLPYSLNGKSVLECFLDWPYQDDFLPTINRLWRIMPGDIYGQCLLALAHKYIGSDEKANYDYDYRSLLGTLWEESPEEYKQYVFYNKKIRYSMTNEGEILLSLLVKRAPFQEKDEELFKRIFRDQPQEKRRAMMLNEGNNMCSFLTRKEKWTSVNELLEECLPKEEIPSFKKQFIKSNSGIWLCLDALEDNREKLVEDLLDWSLESEAEKTQRKNALMSGTDGIFRCESLLREGEFTKVERMINICLSTDEKKERFKKNCVYCACGVLLDKCEHDPSLEDCVWEQMDKIIAWSVNTEKKIRDLKKNLYSTFGDTIHYKFVVIKELWEKIERFYQWFGLFPEEIKQLEKNTLFRCIIEYIHIDLSNFECSFKQLKASLLWFLTDKEMAIDLKKEVEEKYFANVLNEKDRERKERLDHLMTELLDDFRKEVQDKTNGDVFVQATGGKRSLTMIKDEFSFPRKKHK